MNRRTYWVRAEDEAYALKEAYRDGVGCFAAREDAEAVDTADSLFEVTITRHDNEERWTVREGEYGLERLMPDGKWQRFVYSPIIRYDDDFEVREESFTDDQLDVITTHVTRELSKAMTQEIRILSQNEGVG